MENENIELERQKAAFEAGKKAFEKFNMNMCPAEHANHKEFFSKGYESAYAKNHGKSDNDFSFIDEANKK